MLLPCPCCCKAPLLASVHHQEDWLYCRGELFLDDQLVSSAAKGSKIAEEQEALRSIEFYEAPPMLGCKTDP